MIHTAIGWLNALNPFLLRVTENFGIRWYGLSYLLGFFVTYLLASAVARRQAWPDAAAVAADFVFAAALSTVIGGRLGYCLLYDQSLLLRVTSEFPYWGALMIHRGGMASHGAILALFLCCAWFSRSRALSLWPLLDIVAMGGCIGIFFGRIANFINGELVGRAAPMGLSWAVRFPQDLLGLSPRAPELTALAPAAEKVGVSPEHWGRFLIEHRTLDISRTLELLMTRLQAGDRELAELIAPLLTPRHPSQIYEAVLEGLALGICCLVAWKRAKLPGAAAVTFMLLYPVARISGEQFRMPDAQIGFDWLGLTRGQWLSVIMLALGILLWRFRTKTLVARTSAAEISNSHE